MKKKKRSAFKMIIADILFAALIVGGWPLTRLIQVNARARRFENQPAAVVTPAPAVESPLIQPSDPPEDISGEDEPDPLPEEPDDRTEWQKKFEEHFTDETVITENSYTSPNVSVTVTQGVCGAEGKESVYYAADIYIGNIDCFRSYFAHNATYPNRTDLFPRMVEESNAILAINGDYCGFNFGGIIFRNGVMYSDVPNGEDICILLRDGSMLCTDSTAFDITDYGEENVYQIWSFGPSLLSDSGKALTESEMQVPYYLAGNHPRTALGYYEPGHYCFVVADGRQSGYSVGPTMEELAGVMEKLGCTMAYNLDGGGSSMMSLNGTFANKPSTAGERDVPDILLITDIDHREEAEP